MSDAVYLHGDDVAASYAAARRIVPHVIEVAGLPSSMIDVGGGLGAWCRAFKEAGTRSVRCIDQPCAAAETLCIDASEFEPCDLGRTVPAPRRTDLAMSLECAEHLPPERGEALIDFLTKTAPVVLFSAAIPGQPGIGHINCRRPSYWRALFAARDFVLLDVLRPRILYDPAVPAWFKQNIVMYAHREHMAKLKLPERRVFIPEEFELVLAAALERDLTLRDVVAALPGAAWRAVKFRADKVLRRIGDRR